MADFFLGESLVGDGNEVAHIDLIIGSKSGPPAPRSATRSRTTRTASHAARRPDAEPAVQARHRPDHQGDDQGREAGRPDVRPRPGRRGQGRHRLGRRGHHLRRSRPKISCCVCGVFIHWEAADDKKIYDYNYQATKEAIKRALAGKPTIDEMHRRLEDRRNIRSAAKGSERSEGSRRSERSWTLRSPFDVPWSRAFAPAHGLSCANFSCNSTPIRPAQRLRSRRRNRRRRRRGDAATTASPRMSCATSCTARSSRADRTISTTPPSSSAAPTWQPANAAGASAEVASSARCACR